MAYGYRPWEVNLDEVDCKDTVRVRCRKFPPDHQRFVTMASLGPDVYGAAPPHPDHCDPKTLISGGFKRFMRRTPKPDRRLLDRLKEFVRRRLRDEVLWTPLEITSDCTFETWVNSTSYPDWRKEELKELWSTYDGVLLDKYKVCKSFMKDETYMEFKHARCIMSTHDIYKCEVGPTFKQIEKKVFSHPSFIKYVPVPDRPDYIIDRLWQPGGHYVATDYTAYESHFTEELMEAVEFVLYEHMTRHLPNHDKFMSRLSVLKGMRRATFKYFDCFVPATRMSGEMNTSLGNGFANLMLFEFACHELGSECVGVVEGDDGLFRVNGPVPTEEQFAEMGLTIKMVEHPNIETASFCGLVFDIQDRVNVTDVREVLINFGWSGTRHVRFSRKRQMELLRSKSLSYLHQYPGCPIIQSLAMYGLRVTKHIDMERLLRKNRWMSQWERDELVQALGRAVARPVPDRTRALVATLYKIPEWVQKEIEDYLDSLTEISQLHHWSFDLFLQGDCRTYYDNYVVDEDCGIVPGHRPYDGRLSKYRQVLLNWDGISEVPCT